MKTKQCPACMKQIPTKEFKQHRDSHIASMTDIADAIRNFVKDTSR